jgi:hypothetical protein
VGLAPFVAGLMFYGIGGYAIYYYGKAANSEGKIYLGLTLPLWFGLIGMVIGLVLALVSRPFFKTFFARKTETAPPGLLDQKVERAPAHLMGREHVTHGVHLLTPEAEDEEEKPPAPPGG